MCRLHQYPQTQWKKSIFQGKCISRKLLQNRAAAAQHMAVPRYCCYPESRTCWGSISLPQKWVPTPRSASVQPLQNERCREWGTSRRRFFSLWCYHLVICYVLPTPLFLRLGEQKQPLIKIQNYKACLEERKQYLSHIWFWEGYNSHKSWAKLSSITLIVHRRTGLKQTYSKACWSWRCTAGPHLSAFITTKWTLAYYHFKEK